MIHAVTLISALVAGQVTLNSGDTLACASCPCGDTAAASEIANGSSQVVSCTACAECPPAPAGEYVPYEPSVHAGEFVWSSSRWEFTANDNPGDFALAWWNDSRGEGLEYTVPLIPGDQAEFSGVFAEGPGFPYSWGYSAGLAIVLVDDCNWEFAWVGNRPVSAARHVTIEHKRTVNCQSYQADIGPIGPAIADIRVSVQTVGTLSWEYRLPGGGWQTLDPITWAAPRVNCAAGCRPIIAAGAVYQKGVPFTAGAAGVTVQ